jgi:predicted ATPase with chaperone activity
MTVHVPALAPAMLATIEAGESPADVRTRVDAARRSQRERYRKLPGVFCNAHVSGRWLETHTRGRSAGARGSRCALPGPHAEPRAWRLISGLTNAGFSGQGACADGAL